MCVYVASKPWGKLWASGGLFKDKLLKGNTFCKSFIRVRLSGLKQDYYACMFSRWYKVFKIGILSLAYDVNPFHTRF